MRIIVCFCVIWFCQLKVKGQSLISFKETAFEITSTQKDAAGFCYTATEMTLSQGQILIVSANSSNLNFKPVIIVKGPLVNAKEAAPEVKFKKYIYYSYEGLFRVTATGMHTIIIVAAEKGTVGKGKVKIGVADERIFNNPQIMAMPVKNEFTGALSANLKHAIFDFNFGKKISYRDNLKKDSGYVPVVDLPNAIVSDYYQTKVSAFSTTDKNDTPIIKSGVQYCMGIVNYHSLPNPNRETRPYLKKYDFKDTIILLKRYDSLKNVLINSLSKDFTIERETILPIPFEDFAVRTRKDGKAEANGRSIVFTHRGNDRLLPNDHGFSCLAQKQMKIELCVKTYMNTSAGLYLRIYSHGETMIY